jgi:hypothetical protein
MRPSAIRDTTTVLIDTARVLAQRPQWQPAHGRDPGLARLPLKPLDAVRCCVRMRLRCQLRRPCLLRRRLRALRLMVTTSWLLPAPHGAQCRFLAGNQLTGRIPDSLSSLSNLLALCAPIAGC